MRTKKHPSARILMGVFLCVLLERFAPDANNLDLLAILTDVERNLMGRRVAIEERQDEHIRGFSTECLRDISDAPTLDEFVQLCIFSQNLASLSGSKTADGCTRTRSAPLSTARSGRDWLAIVILIRCQCQYGTESVPPAICHDAPALLRVDLA